MRLNKPRRRLRMTPIPPKRRLMVRVLRPRRRPPKRLLPARLKKIRIRKSRTPSSKTSAESPIRCRRSPRTATRVRAARIRSTTS